MKAALLGTTRRTGELAALAIAHGVTVVLLDSTDQVEQHVRACLDEIVIDGRLEASDRDAALERLDVHGATDGVDLVIETAPEKPVAKHEAVSRADGIGDGPIVTTTTVLAVEELAGKVGDPTRVVGLSLPGAASHRNPIAELAASRRTGAAALEAARSLAAMLGKEVVEVADRPGFLAQRLLVPYLNDVVTCFDEGLASAEDLDVALELGLGYPKGPLTVLDEIGLDVHLERCEALHKQLTDPHVAPPALLRRMVAAGEVGNRAGKGFRVGVEHEEEQA